MTSRLSVAAAAREAPDRIALDFGDRVVTFRALDERVRACAAWLRARGVGPGTRVAVVAHTDEPTFTLLYALIETAATAVIVHPRLLAAERDVVFARACPALVVTDARSAIDAAAAAATAASLPPDDDALPLGMLFTSGTSGVPKGAVLARRAFVAAAEANAANLGWQEDDRWLLCMPPAHVGGLSILTRCLIARRTVTVVDRFTPDAVARALRDRGVTLASLVPTMLHRLFEDPGWRPPPKVRATLLGGAAASPELVEEARRRGVPALTTYGLTEACSQVTTQRYGTAPDPANGSGEPVAGVELRVVDGEIQVRGPALMTGYFRVDAQPFTEDGWLRTGDLGSIDARGRLHVDGRRSDLVVTGGENVYPAEVEAAIEKLPGVRAACVFGVPDPAWGQLVAVAIVPRDPSAPPRPEDLEAAFVASLAPHKRPRRLAFVDELPTTSSGKLRRAEAKALHAAALRPLRAMV